MAPQLASPTNINNPYAGMTERGLLGAAAIQPMRASRLAMGVFEFCDDGALFALCIPLYLISEITQQPKCPAHQSKNQLSTFTIGHSADQRRKSAL